MKGFLPGIEESRAFPFGKGIFSSKGHFLSSKRKVFQEDDLASGKRILFESFKQSIFFLL